MFAALLALALTAAPDAGPEPVVELVKGGRTTRQSRVILGTKVTVAIADPPRAELANHQLHFDAAFVPFLAMEVALSDSRDDAVVPAIQAANKAPVAAGLELCNLVALALETARKSKGTYEPTAPCGSWKELDLRAVKMPSPACTLRLKKPGITLQLAPLALASGVDRAVKVLRNLGYVNFMVQAGSDQYFAGGVGDRGWKMTVRDPKGADDKSFARGEVTETAVSTRGAIATCRPSKKAAFVTALAPTTVEAMLLAEATLTRGFDEKLKLLVVEADGTVKANAELKAQLDLTPH